jgi:hypothetical protein
MFESQCSILILFVIGIVRHKSFASLSVLSFEMLVQCNGFDFESIKTIIFFIVGYNI